MNRVARGSRGRSGGSVVDSVDPVDPVDRWSRGWPGPPGPADQVHQGVGGVGVGGLVEPGPSGPAEEPVGVGLQGRADLGPHLGGEQGVQAEGPLGVGEGPAPALVVEPLVVAGLLLPGPALGLGPQALAP